MFWDDVRSNSTETEMLPLFHSTEAFFIEDIIKNRRLDTSMCKFYNEELLYFFYGRPGYRNISPKQSTRIIEYYPISLIFSTKSFDRAYRIMPFDSGAFFRGLYSQYMHPKMTADRFIIPSPVENLSKIVDFFFGTSKNYLKGIQKDGLKVRSTQYEIASYCRMIGEYAISSSDDRRMTFEIQANNGITLDGRKLSGIIAPSDFLDEPYFVEFVKKESIPVSYYDIFVSNPREIYGLIFDKSNDMLRDMGVLK